jgi:hypothetical protein
MAVEHLLVRHSHRTPCHRTGVHNKAAIHTAPTRVARITLREPPSRPSNPAGPHPRSELSPEQRAHCVHLGFDSNPEGPNGWHTHHLNGTLPPVFAKESHSKLTDQQKDALSKLKISAKGFEQHGTQGILPRYLRTWKVLAQDDKEHAKVLGYADKEDKRTLWGRNSIGWDDSTTGKVADLSENYGLIKAHHVLWDQLPTHFKTAASALDWTPEVTPPPYPATRPFRQCYFIASTITPTRPNLCVAAHACTSEPHHLAPRRARQVWNQIQAILAGRRADAERAAETARAAQSAAAKAAHEATKPTAQQARVGAALAKKTENKRSEAPPTSAEEVRAAKSRKKSKSTKPSKKPSHFFQAWSPRDTIFMDNNSHEDKASRDFFTTGYGAWPDLDPNKPGYLTDHPDGPQPYSRLPGRPNRDNAILKTANASAFLS